MPRLQKRVPAAVFYGRMTTLKPNDDEKTDFWYGLLSNDAAFPYDFRRKTGLIIELNLVSARTLEMLHGTLSTDLVLRSGMDALRQFPAKVNALEEQVKHTRPGTQLLSGDLSPLFSLLLVHFYTALEAGITDMLLVAIRFRPGIVGHLSRLGVAKLPPEVNRDLTLFETERVFKRLKQWAGEVGRDAGDSAPKGWLRQLEAAGLSLSMNETNCSAIRELVYVRNCIAHSGSRMNKDCVDEMSVLPAKEGQTIRLTTPAMGAYVVACMAMANELVRVAQLPCIYTSDAS